MRTPEYKVSVILPTYNPNPIRLASTLNSLSKQTLNTKIWELIIIDNNSTNNVIENCIKLVPEINYKFVFEKQQGLTWARLRGFEESLGEIIVMVDDDNVLERSYLQDALTIMASNPKLGAIGGPIVGEFEMNPPAFIDQFSKLLAIRNLGEKTILYEPSGSAQLKYPECSPVGAGMILRKQAISQYCKDIHDYGTKITDRKGTSLSSGGDNDIVISILKNGYTVGYFPQLKLTHLIPSNRLQVKYLAKLNQESSKSWSQLLLVHGISPWQPIPKWTLFFRKLKAFFNYQPWKSSSNYISWKGACGHFEGRVRG